VIEKIFLKIEFQPNLLIKFLISYHFHLTSFLKPDCFLIKLLLCGGSTVTFKNQRKVRFRLAILDESYTTDFFVEAATVPTVSAQFERIVTDPAEFEYLRHLSWTEPLPMLQQYYGSESSIDFLLGLPFQTLIRKPPYFVLGPLGSPSAVITELGNCISVDNLQKRNVQNVNLCFP
jgi:hypothetical protein